MELMTILAETVETSAKLTAETELIPLDQIWEQIIALSWLQAVIAISFGMVYMLYGWRIFKVLVVICFGLVGMFAGINIGQRFDSQIAGAIAGLILLAAISIPMMRWAVSLLGAITGGILAGGLWYAFELPGQYLPAGAGIGLVAGGMISFIVFRIAVMLFTSFGGGALIVTGLVALVHQYESMREPPTERIKDLFMNQNWFLPVLLLIPTVIGIIVQNKFIKGSREWNV
ncbi:MAG: TMEM198/TM7SF3 family protein [Sedimentisphaerales bacterium]|nr:TMEM198/TM7SF3 family protein [Sedimentisphaerales bacterium]